MTSETCRGSWPIRAPPCVPAVAHKALDCGNSSAVRPLSAVLCKLSSSDLTLSWQPYPGDPCIQIISTLGPKVCRYYLHWALWILRATHQDCTPATALPRKLIKYSLNARLIARNTGSLHPSNDTSKGWCRSGLHRNERALLWAKCATYITLYIHTGIHTYTPLCLSLSPYDLLYLYMSTLLVFPVISPIVVPYITPFKEFRP